MDINKKDNELIEDKIYDEGFTDDILTEYIRDIKDIPVLSSEEEIELFKRLSNGDESAREIIARHNLKLVVSIVKKYNVTGVNLLDLIQEGNIGLMTAIEKFDYTLGNKFSTYAINWIKQAATRYLYNNGRTVRIPVHIMEQIRKMHRTTKELQQKLKVEPTDAQVAEALEIEVDKLMELRVISQDVVSLDSPVGADDDGDSTLGDFITNDSADDRLTTEEMYEKQELREIIEHILMGLGEREKEVLIRRFGLYGNREETLEEIGTDFGVTRERIRQLEARGIKYLRNPKYRRILRDFIK